MARTPQADWLRNAFYENRCNTIEGVSYSHFRAFFETVWHSSIDNYQSIGFQVGGYGGAWARNNGNGTVTYHVKNDASLHSLIPFLKSPARTTGPFSTIHQTFEWTETIDQSLCGQSTEYRKENLRYDGLILVGDEAAQIFEDDSKRVIHNQNPLSSAFNDPEFLGRLAYIIPGLVEASFDDGGGYY